jgi:hypothetical protein
MVIITDNIKGPFSREKSCDGSIGKRHCLYCDQAEMKNARTGQTEYQFQFRPGKWGTARGGHDFTRRFNPATETQKCNVKGTVTRDFRLSVFSSINPT